MRIKLSETYMLGSIHTKKIASAESEQNDATIHHFRRTNRARYSSGPLSVGLLIARISKSPEPRISTPGRLACARDRDSPPLVAWHSWNRRSDTRTSSRHMRDRRIQKHPCPSPEGRRRGGCRRRSRRPSTSPSFQRD